MKLLRGPQSTETASTDICITKQIKQRNAVTRTDWTNEDPFMNSFPTSCLSTFATEQRSNCSLVNDVTPVNRQTKSHNIYTFIWLLFISGSSAFQQLLPLQHLCKNNITTPTPSYFLSNAITRPLWGQIDHKADLKWQIASKKHMIQTLNLI